MPEWASIVEITLPIPELVVRGTVIFLAVLIPLVKRANIEPNGMVSILCRDEGETQSPERPISA